MGRTTIVWMCAAMLLSGGCKPAVTTKLKHGQTWAEQPGWRNHDTRYGFSIAAPNDWGYRPVSGIDMSMLSGGMPRTDQPDQPDPQMEELDLKKGIQLTLYDRAEKPVAGETMTRLYVKKEDTGGTTLVEAAKDVQGRLGKEAKMTAIDTPIGPAAEFKWSNTMSTGDVVYHIEYVVVDDKDLYRIVFEATNNAGPIESAGPPVAQTFRVK